MKPPMLRYPWQPPAPTKRGVAKDYDAKWRALRLKFLAANPRCVHCRNQATEVDHIHPIAERPDLRLVWANLRALCKSCHSRRTAADHGFAERRRFA